jgi:hypothetical protein
VDYLRRHPDRRHSRSWVDWFAALIVLTQVVVRTYGAARGYWYNDDWGSRYAIRIRPLHLAVNDYFRLVAGHFWPGPSFLFRFVEAIAPNSFGAAVLVGGVLQGIGTVLVYLLLRRLFGPRPVVALLLLWFAFTTLTLGSSNWINVAYYTMPFQIAFAGLALLFLRYLDRPSHAGAAYIFAVELFALCWYEKAAFIPFALFALVAWFPVVTARPIGARRAWREYRQLWTLLGIALALYLLLYLVLDSVGFTTPGGASANAQLGATIRLTGVVFQSFIVSVFGGPWRWTSGSTVVGANPPLALAVLAFVLFGALVVWTSARRRVARAAWIGLLVYLLAQVALLAYGRAGVYGTGLGRYYRYFADAAIPATLALAFALLPTRREHALAAPPAPPPKWPRFVQVGAYLGLASLFLVSVGVSSSGELAAWASNPGRPYVANARADFGLVAHTPLIFQQVPTGVLPSVFAPVNTTQVLLALSPGHPKFQSTVDDHLYAVDPSGHIGPARVVGWQSLEGPVSGCGWAVTAPRASIPLNGKAFDWNWYVDVHYHANSAVLAQVLFGTGSDRVHFKPGTHDIFFPIIGGASNVQIAATQPDAGLCVASLTVGALHVEINPRLRPRT